MEKTTEMNLLYDFYGSLLTEKQQQLLEMYYVEDWSLGEIAEHNGVSRQAVFEAIKRAKQSLSEFEAKLGLMRHYIQRQKIAEQVLHLLQDLPEIKQQVQPLIVQMVDQD
ncbi:YlxM family DNA-binding protein [Polycladospora coralii]|uniref:YlxM family DNA-binding protein n=1 Tax=Polycladospora coralii TaxID=2771432 RepID=UPI001CD1633B|nr:putative DNA-binding protein [Polycladospora coralii]